MKTQILKVALLLVGIIAFAGCASTGIKSNKSSYTFFPLPPDEPRIQFLTGFGSETDLHANNKLADFVVGGQRIQRPIWKPYGITTTKGSIVVCDTQAANLGVVDLQTAKLHYIRPSGRDALQTPINVAIDSAGNRYVTDTKRGQVIIFDKIDDKVGEIGTGKDMTPCGVFIAGENLYITDLKSHQVHVYSVATRKLAFSLPQDLKDEHSRLLSPTNVSVDKQGYIYVTDTGGFTTKVFDSQGKYVRTTGELGLEPGRFSLPKGIAVDRERRMYVVDASTSVVQVFDEQGRLLMFFGEPKTSGPGALYLPAGIAIDYENIPYFQKYVAPGYKLDHLILVTSQAGPQKVNIFGFIKKV